jgi:hypothetical protein
MAVRGRRWPDRHRARSRGSPTKNGPNTVDSVASFGFGLPRPTVSIETPSTSASSTNSCLLPDEALPVRVRKSIAVKYSSSVRSTSRANACRCRTSAPITAFVRGFGLLSKLATAAAVRSSPTRSIWSFLLLSVPSYRVAPRVEGSWRKLGAPPCTAYICASRSNYTKVMHQPDRPLRRG